MRETVVRLTMQPQRALRAFATDVAERLPLMPARRTALIWAALSLRGRPGRGRSCQHGRRFLPSAIQRSTAALPKLNARWIAMLDWPER